MSNFAEKSVTTSNSIYKDTNVLIFTIATAIFPISLPLLSAGPENLQGISN